MLSTVGSLEVLADQVVRRSPITTLHRSPQRKRSLWDFESVHSLLFPLLLYSSSGGDQKGKGHVRAYLRREPKSRRTTTFIFASFRGFGDFLMTSLFLLLRALALASAVALVRSQDISAASSSGDLTDSSEPTSTSSAAASSSATGVTKVVQVFFIDERSYEGLPYTLLHRDSGSVIGVNADLTTLVITSTRVDQRPSPTHTRTDNVTTGIITLASSHRVGHVNNTTGQPSTITQGPATFMFTGTRFGPDHTL